MWLHYPLDGQVNSFYGNLCPSFAATSLCPVYLLLARKSQPIKLNSLWINRKDYGFTRRFSISCCIAFRFISSKSLLDSFSSVCPNL